jgi:uncharacterized protein YjbI with pentapeptide repeats
MVYLNNDDGLYYKDAEFINIANGIAPFDKSGGASNTGDILYVNGVPTLHKNSGDGLWYTDQGFTNPANGPTGLTAFTSASNERWFINGQQTGLHEDGSGNWNGQNYRAGEADFTGTYAGGLGLPDGFYVNGVRTTLGLWSGHGVWNNKIYGSSVWVNDKEAANETHLNGFTSYIQTDNYGGFTQLTDLTDVDFSSVVSVAGANFTGLDLSGLDFSSFTDFSLVNFYNAKVNNANFSGRNLWGTTFETYVNLGFAETAGADFSNATIGEIFGNLSGANFSNAVFKGSISGAIFSGANLAGANFSDATANYGNATFDGATDVTGTIFPVNFVGLVNGTWRFGSSVTSLDNLTITDADLTGVDFSNITSMANAYFTGSNLAGADLSNVTNLEGANFNGADLTGVTFPSSVSGYYGNIYFVSGQATTLDSNGNGIWNNKPYWNGSGSNLDGADFSNQDLSTVDFSDVRSVVGANFSSSTLDNIGYGHNGQTYPNSTVPAYLLEGAIFYGATLKNCYITGYTQGTNYNATYLENCDIGGDFSNADLSDIRFVSSRLNDANFAGANLYAAMFNNIQTIGTTDFTGASYRGYLSINDYSIQYLTPARGFTFTGENTDYSSSTGWFINGVATTLCPGGDGIWTDVPYFSGTPNPTYTGWAFGCRAESAYYINGVAKSGLDETGTGVSGGQTYVNGVVQNDGGGGSENTLIKIESPVKFFGKVKFGV